MRRLLIAAAALALPGMAQAQAYEDAPITESLPSPEVIDRGAGAVGRVVEGLLDVDVGPVRDAIDPGRPRAGGRETIGDMARRDDPYFEERLDRSIGTLADSLILLRSRMQRLEPALRRSLRDIQRSVDEALRDVPERGYRDYRDDPDY